MSDYLTEMRIKTLGFQATNETGAVESQQPTTSFLEYASLVQQSKPILIAVTVCVVFGVMVGRLSV